MSTEFWQTVMGHRFIEGTMPKLVRAVETLGKNLENLRVVPTDNALIGRKIMLLPRVSDDHWTAVLSPQGMDHEAASKKAEEILSELEDQDRRDQESDPNHEGWCETDLMNALTLQGFLALEVFEGPTWDRRG